LPDVHSPDAQGGVESKEFGFLVRHPGPSPDFFKWALDMKLKVIGVDCGCAEHPMNTNIRYMHEREFQKAEAKLQAEHGKSWDEMFPQDEYYELTHITMPKAHLLLAESIVGEFPLWRLRQPGRGSLRINRLMGWARKSFSRLWTRPKC
jgi:hypothetical protein